jgi:hypothetical protein
LQTRLFPQESFLRHPQAGHSTGGFSRVYHKEEPHLVRQLLCYFGQKHASEKMSFSFADPKSHAAEKQGQKHYQYFDP